MAPFSRLLLASMEGGAISYSLVYMGSEMIESLGRAC